MRVPKVTIVADKLLGALDSRSQSENERNSGWDVHLYSDKDTIRISRCLFVRRGCTYLEEVLAVVPFKSSRDEGGVKVNPVPSTILLIVTGQHNLVVTRHLDANAVVRERVRMVEIEDEEKTSPFKNDHFVALRG